METGIIMIAFLVGVLGMVIYEGYRNTLRHNKEYSETLAKIKSRGRKPIFQVGDKVLLELGDFYVEAEIASLVSQGKSEADFPGISFKIKGCKSNLVVAYESCHMTHLLPQKSELPNTVIEPDCPPPPPPPDPPVSGSR